MLFIKIEFIMDSFKFKKTTNMAGHSYTYTYFLKNFPKKYWHTDPLKIYLFLIFNSINRNC